MFHHCLSDNPTSTFMYHSNISPFFRFFRLSGYLTISSFWCIYQCFFYYFVKQIWTIVLFLNIQCVVYIDFWVLKNIVSILISASNFKICFYELMNYMAIYLYSNFASVTLSFYMPIFYKQILWFVTSQKIYIRAVQQGTRLYQDTMNVLLAHFW